MTNVQKQNFCNKPLLNHSSKSTQDFTKATLPWKLVQGLSPCDIFFESTNILKKTVKSILKRREP